VGGAASGASGAPAQHGNRGIHIAGQRCAIAYTAVAQGAVTAQQPSGLGVWQTRGEPLERLVRAARVARLVEHVDQGLHERQ